MRKKRVEYPGNCESYFNFFSRTVEKLNSVSSDRDVYSSVAEILKDIVPEGTIILVHSFNPDTNALFLQALKGPGPELSDIGSILCHHVKELSFPVPKEALPDLLTGECNEIYGGLKELTFGLLSSKTCYDIEAMPLFGRVYRFGFSWEERLTGTVTCILPPGIELENDDEISLFLLLVAGLLHLKQSEELLTRSKELSSTEQKNAYDGCISEQSSLDLILNTVADPVFIKNENHQRILVNDAYCRLIGRNREELINKTDHEIYSLKQAEICTREDNVVFASGTERVTQEQITDYSGQVHSMVTKKNLLVDSWGNRFIVGISRDVTERKRAEDALRQSEERLSHAMSAADLGIWTWNLITDERHVYFGQRTLFGYTEQELEDYFRNIELLAHPLDRDSTGALIHPIRNSKTRDAVEFELRIQEKRGSWRSLLIRGSVIQRDAEEKPVLLMGAFRDITEQKQHEDQIIRLSALKEKLLGISDLQSQMRLVSEEVVAIFNADFVRIWLIKNADICDAGCKHASVTVGPDVCRDRERCLHLMASSGRYTHTDGDHRRIPLGCYKIGRLVNDTDPFFITNDVTHDPRVHDHAWAESLGLISFAGFRLLSQDLEPTGVLGLFKKSVIPPREAELLIDLANTLSQVIISGIATEELRENEAKYKALYEGANDAIFIMDNLFFMDCNRKTEVLLGCSRDQIIGHCQTDFSPEFQPDGVSSEDRAYDKIHSVLAGEPQFFEWVFFHSDNALVYTEVSLNRISFRGNFYIQAIVRDITERKKGEDALRKAHEELEIKVQERTKALRESEKRLRLKLDSVLSPDYDLSNLELVNILDIPTIQSLMEDFTRLTGMTTAIIDLQGNVIESTGWQDICSQFHRVNEKTRQNCSDSVLLSGRNANPGHIIMKKCKNNLWNVVTPLYIGNNHAGNIYTGQFFYDDETVDETIFRSQAEEYGFDREEYLSALRRVPRFDRNQIDNLMDYLVKFTEFISRLSYSNLKLARTMVEEKNVKEALIRSEHRLSDIINHLPDATFAVDLQGKVIVWNKAIEEMTGITSKEILGKDQYEYALPFYGYRRPILIDLVLETDEELEKQYTFIKREGDILIGEADQVLPDGRSVNLWGKATSLHDGFGNTIGAIESIRDVTERRKAEDALRESEDKFRDMAEKSLAGIFLIQGGIFYYINATLAEIFDYQVEEITGHLAPQDLIIPKDWPVLEENLRKGISGEIESLHYELKGITKHKKVIDLDVFGSRTHYRGKPAIIGTLLDVTERKQAETAIHESEQKFHAVFDAAQDGMLVADPETRRFVMANDTIMQQTGYCEAELLSLSINDIHPPADLPYVTEQFEKLIHGEIFLSSDIPVLRKDGTIFFTDVKSSVVVLQGRDYYLGTFRDATERIRAGEELQKLYNELEKRVVERTAQLSLTQAAFQQANKKLSLLSSITRHDINNQLQALRGYLELSKESLDDPASLSELITKEEKIAGTIAHQIHFTKDYEDLGLTSPIWQNVVIIIKSAIARLPMRDIYVDAGDPHLEMYADPLLGKVFYNLIDNALRYGGDKMTLIRIANYQDNEKLIIVVEDDGKGISTDDKKRLFTKGFGKNTGLGLFLSREILSITGITITETGIPGQGARFEITVPGDMWQLSQWDTKKE